MRVIPVQPVERTRQLRLRRHEDDQAADEQFRYYLERSLADVNRQLSRRAVLIARLRSYDLPEVRSA